MALFFAVLLFLLVAFLIARWLVFLKLRRVDLDSEEKSCDSILFWKVFLFLFCAFCLALPFFLGAWRDALFSLRMQNAPYIGLMKSYYPNLYDNFVKKTLAVNNTLEEELLLDDFLLEMRNRWQENLQNGSDEVLLAYMIFLYKEGLFLAQSEEDCALLKQKSALFMRLNEAYLSDIMFDYFSSQKIQPPYFSAQEESVFADLFLSLQANNKIKNCCGAQCVFSVDFMFYLLNDLDYGVDFMRWLLMKEF